MSDQWNKQNELSPSQGKGKPVKEDSDKGSDGRAWRLIENLAQGALKEQRRSRRWGVFFKSMTFVWLFAFVFVAHNTTKLTESKPTGGNHTALVDIDGAIGGGEVEADTVVSGLRAAFENEGTKAVILRINSPGGSPVQSGYIYDEMHRLKALYPDMPLYSVITDIGASGGYYIAAGGDEIYADKASLVGSIGVISSGFGFVDAMEKLGITRRTYTAGEFKAFNDPFQPQDERATKRWQQSLDAIHQQFITAVKQGRGDRLSDSPDLFSGMIWTGEQAVELGLVDGLGSTGYVAREVVGVEEIVDFTMRVSPLEKFAKDLGLSASVSAMKILGVDAVMPR